jgi:murein DD-endopeptidase MepM/ murein hydrolase activator NlpD
MRYGNWSRAVAKLFFVMAMASLPLRSLAAAATPPAVVLCTNELIRVTTQTEADKVHFFVQNLQSVEVTVTFEMGMERLTANVAFPCTQTFSGGRTIKAFTLTRTDPKRRGNYHYTTFYTFGNVWAKHDDKYVYALPYAPGKSYRVIQGYNGKFSHNGDNQYAIDWQMPEGTPVLAARDGLVIGTKDDSSLGGADKKYSGCANYVMVRHSDGTIGHYVHLQKGGAKVKVGQKVKVGDVVALSGNTGFSSGPHLHFAVFKAKNGRERQTFPIKFKTAEGAVALARGQRYEAP